MQVSCVVTAHANPNGLAHIVDVLLGQTKLPYEILVYYSDMTPPQLPGGIILSEQSNHNDWGHEKRAVGLTQATGTLVGFFNDDDDYAPTYIEKLALPDYDLIYCDFMHKSGEFVPSEPRLRRISSGNFLVRTTVAQSVGYNHRTYEADGLFVEDLKKAGISTKHVPELLYYHR